jgi:hypothetical protein
VSILRSLAKRLEHDGLFFNLYFAFGWTRFSLAVVQDVLWYATLPRKFMVAYFLSLVLCIAWLFRPWLEIEEETQE